MMIDKKWIGYETPSSVIPVEAGRLKFFAKAIGETDPVYIDEAAAAAAGYSALPAPPTFLFSAELDSGVLFDRLDQLGVDKRKMLHGQQKFEYLAPIVAGDTITVRSKVANIYDKKDGALEFIEVESIATNQTDQNVARIFSTVVVRH